MCEAVSDTHAFNSLARELDGRQAWERLMAELKTVEGLEGADPDVPTVVALQDFCVAHRKTQAMFKRVTSVFTLTDRALEREGKSSTPVVPLQLPVASEPN